MKKLLILLLASVFIGQVGKQNSYAHNKKEEKKEEKKGILLVTFGTSYPEARSVFDKIDKQVKQKFPDVEVRWAYTSKIIRKILKKRGEKMASPVEALAKMGEDGFTHVAVQSLHIIPGEEFENLEKTVESFNKMPKGIELAKLGKPLLYQNEDNKKMASLLDQKFGDKLNAATALVLMGHGSHHAANVYYPGFQYYLNQKSDRYFIGTVEGFPELPQVISKLKKNGIKKAVLTPFMSVAGDHARNDMAGDEEESWKSRLEKEGFQVEIVMKGLADYEEVIDIWIDHLETVYHQL